MMASPLPPPQPPFPVRRCQLIMMWDLLQLMLLPGLVTVLPVAHPTAG